MIRALALLALLLLASPEARAQSNSGGFPKAQNALSNTAVVLKAGRGVLRTINCGNGNAAITFLQFWDTTSAVVVGTTAPTFVVPLPVSNAFGFPADLNFQVGLKVAATTTATGGSAPSTALTCTFGVN